MNRHLMQPTAAPPEQSLDAAEALAADARLLLEAGRPQGAALLHAEAVKLLLGALRLNGAGSERAESEAGPAALPRGDALAARFRAVWLDRSEALTRAPGMAELRAMADGLRALVPAVRARIAPPSASAPAPAHAPPSAPTSAPTSAPAKSPAPVPAAAPPRKGAARPSAPAVAAVRKPAPSRGVARPGRPTPDAAPPAARPVAPPAPQPRSPPAPLRPVSSAAFWSLMDRWGVDDTDALGLLGHAGGLTRRGTRPRFRLDAAEAARFHLLQTLDDALGALGTDPRAWLRTAVPDAPFRGAAPLATLLRAGDAARRETTLRDAARQVMGEGLRRSLG